MTLNDSEQEKPTRTWKSWFQRWFAYCFCAAVILWAVHPWLLREIGRQLIHPVPAANVETLVVLDGRLGYERARQLIEAGDAEKLVLHRKQPSRVVELGVLPTHLELSQAVVRELEFPEGTVQVWDGEYGHIDEVLLKAIAEEQRNGHVGLVVTKWRSQLLHERMTRLAQNGEAVPQLILIDDPEVHPGNWWTTRHGVRL
ncbi:MAG: hypothetical protein KDA88_15710, partial [Planctomycetaceae bacterium]|nr:hypothetical protein [Planctomycetaceae bacterium]